MSVFVTIAGVMVLPDGTWRSIARRFGLEPRA
jgi:hypothetical protein